MPLIGACDNRTSNRRQKCSTWRSCSFSAAAAAAEPAYFRIELSPSGSPGVDRRARRARLDGRFSGLSRREVDERAPVGRFAAPRGSRRRKPPGPPPASLVSIGTLAMQGGSPSLSGSMPAKPAPDARATAQGPRIVPTNDGLALTTAQPTESRTRSALDALNVDRVAAHGLGGLVDGFGERRDGRGSCGRALPTWPRA